MSKERLEEIEAKYSTLTVSSERDANEYTEVDVKDLVFLIQNGFKQAELVQELEKENKLLRFIAEENKIAYEQRVEQNKRYRDLLEKIKEMTRYADCREAEIYELVSDELEGEE